MPKKRIGLVLGSGSARGWAHAGVLLELRKNKIPIDVITGTSIGALFGAIYACGKLDEMVEFGLKLEWDKVARYYLPSMPRGGLIKNSSVDRFLSQFFEDCGIEKLNFPFAAVAADALTGKEIIFDGGSVYFAVKASMAIPGVIEPLWDPPYLLVDGGIVNPVPVELARNLGADRIIAVNLNSYKMNQQPEKRKRLQLPARIKSKYSRSDRATRISGWLKKNFEIDLNAAFRSEAVKKVESPLNIIDVLNNSFYIMQMEISKKSISAGKPEVILKPRMENVRMLDFLKAEQGIEEGKKVVREALPEIEKILAD